MSLYQIFYLFSHSQVAISIVELLSTIVSPSLLTLFSAANIGLETALQQWRALLQNLTTLLELTICDLCIMCKQLI
jgi:hypothetical protein